MELWTPTIQETFLKENVGIALADTKYESILYEGDKLHKPYGSYPRVQDYTKGTDITVKDISTTDDSITVDTTKVASFYVDDIDRIQNKYETIKEFAGIAGRQLSNVIDQAVISQYSVAGSALDAGDINGTSGSGIVLSTSNISSIFVAAGRSLTSLLRTDPNKFALIGPRTLETLQLSIANRETMIGDKVGMNGKVGDRFGFDLRLSNNLPYSAVLGLATQVTEGDTVIIAGVTFTFNATPSGAGSVDIGSDVDVSRANLAAAINDSGTAGTTYIALSAEDRQKIEQAGITATNDNSADTLTIAGYGDLVVSETLDDGTDAWGSQKQYLLMGIKKAITLIVQKQPGIEFRKAQLRLGKYVHPWTLFGKGTWIRNRDSLVSVEIDCSAWV